MSSNDTFAAVDAEPNAPLPRRPWPSFLNLAEDELAIGRDQPCTYRRAQGIVSSHPNEATSPTVGRPAGSPLHCADESSQANLPTGAFASTDLVPIHMSIGPDWGLHWPPIITHIPGRQSWEPYAPPESVVMDFTFSPSSWPGLLEEQSIHSQHNPSPPCPGDSMESFSFAFLGKFTSTTGFVKSFDCGTSEEREMVVRGCMMTRFNKVCTGDGDSQPAPADAAENTGKESDTVVETDPHIWGYILQEEILTLDARTQCQRQTQMRPLYTEDWMHDPSQEFRNASVASGRDTGATQNLNHDLQSPHHFLSHPLSLTTHEISSRIKEVISLKPRNSIIGLTWSSLLEEMCLRFFSPPNLLKYLELYWACWHPNWPVVHKPTFNPVAAHPILVAAMALVGACVSPDAHDNENARTWFDSVEEMAFSDEDFCDNSRAGSTSTVTFDASTTRRKVQALQAAYAVCLYQNWEGSDRNKRRIRRYRYSTVVAVARDLGLGNAQHEATSFDWHEFAVREEFIRTLIYIFLLDTGFVIFNNLPPRMVIKELKMDLVCPESCFQADTADECFVSVMSWRSSKSQQRKMSLGSAIETVLAEDMDQSTREAFAELGILNLFAIASALHYLTFQLQSSFSHEPRLAPLRSALANWKQIWLLQASSNDLGADMSPNEEASRSSFGPREMWKRVGFMRNAPEFWLLAKVVLERLEADRHQGKLTDTSADSFRERVDLLSSRSPVLEKYDETSMRQINDIITMFQRLNV